MNQHKVTIFAPGSALWDGYQHALACYEGGILKEFITSLYYKPNSFPYSLMQYLPSNLCDKFKGQARRRYIDGLDESFVTTYPCWELISLMFKRINKDLAHKIVRHRNYLMDQKLGKSLDPDEIGILLAYTYSFEEARIKGIKCILGQRSGHFETAQRIYSEEAELNPDFPSTLSCDFSVKTKGTLRRQIELIDFVIIPSNFVRSTFIDAGVDPQKLVVIPYGVDVDKFVPKVDRNDDGIFRVLFVGRVWQRKGIKYLLEAFKQLSLPNSELILIGEIFEDKTALAPYEGYFRHIPHVLHNELPQYYSMCDIFVFPSLFEGLALVLLEAMASGLPVIASENTGACDVVRDGRDGFIVPIRDVEALKEKILLVYENKDLLYTIGKNAREQAEKFTWQLYRQNIREFLAGLL